MSAISRNNVKISGAGNPPLIFAHGFGCDQSMWRFVAPGFSHSHTVVTFDHVGAGQSDLSAFSIPKYETLHGYADDVIEILVEAKLSGSVFVGHSVSAMIGVLATIKAPQLFSGLILVGPSPRYVDDVGYAGGFTQHDMESLLEFLDANYLGWSAAMAPTIMGNPDRPELGDELTNSFCRTDPALAKHFARTTFLSDNRRDLADVTTRTLILQCSDDVIAPVGVGEYVHKHVPNSEFVQLRASGHCPNLSAPDEVTASLRAFLAKAGQ